MTIIRSQVHQVVFCEQCNTMAHARIMDGSYHEAEGWVVLGQTNDRSITSLNLLCSWACVLLFVAEKEGLNIADLKPTPIDNDNQRRLTIKEKEIA